MRTHATPADRATASPGREPEAVTVGDVLLPSGFPLCSALQRVTERCCPRVAPRSPAPAPAPAARGQRARYSDAPKKKCGTCSSVWVSKRTWKGPRSLNRGWGWGGTWDSYVIAAQWSVSGDVMISVRWSCALIRSCRFSKWDVRPQLQKKKQKKTWTAVSVRVRVSWPQSSVLNNDGPRSCDTDEGLLTSKLSTNHRDIKFSSGRDEFRERAVGILTLKCWLISDDPGTDAGTSMSCFFNLL